MNTVLCDNIKELDANPDSMNPLRKMMITKKPSNKGANKRGTK